MSSQIKETTLNKLETILDLAKKHGATEAEVIQKSWTDNPVNFENNKLKTLESNESSGISLRLIKNKKLGMSSTTDQNALEMLITSACESSEFGPEATFEFSKEKLAGTDEIDQVSMKKPDLPLENLLERGTSVIESLRTFHKDLLISVGFNLGYGETIYLNSNGVFGKRDKNIYSTSLYAHLVRGEDFLGIYDGNNQLEDFPCEKELKNKIYEKLSHSKENISLETKKYPVIFTPRAVENIFGYILSVILNGKLIQQGISPLTNKLKEKLFDEKLSFIENPGVGTAKAEFDDEGISTKKKTLIRNGTINEFYFDLSSATKTIPKQNSTGNGFKSSLSAAPSPSLTSIEMPGGKTSYLEIIKNIKDGVIIDQLLGAGQSNTLAGEFSVGIDLGFKIKNGVIQGRIKNCMVAGNIFDLLKSISIISKEQEWIDGSQLIPYMFFDNLTVVGK